MHTVHAGIRASLAVLAGIAVVAAAGEAPEPDDAAAWIDRVNDALLPGRTILAQARIATTDGMGGEHVHVVDIARMEGEDATRTLVEVEAPAEGQGVVYEIVARPGEPLERWAWLPHVRRLRRIVGVHRTDPFLGTEFTYEDLGLVMPFERRTGEVRFVDDAGRRLVEIESANHHYYSRIVTRVDPATALPMRVRFYDRAGQLFREQRFERVEEIDGHPFPTEILVADRITGARSRLRFTSVDLDSAVPMRIFSDSAVRRRLALRESGEKDGIVPAGNESEQEGS